MNRSHKQAFTLLELLVVISIIAIMASLALPHILSTLTKGEMLQTVNNQKQLYFATQALAMDASANGAMNGGWPGDMTAPSFSAWATALCSGYLSTNDFCKLCSAPGITVPIDHLPTTAEQTAFRVYAVQEESDGNAIFLITRNATIQGNGPTTTITLDRGSKPYGNKGCVLMHRAGDAVPLLPNQLTNSRAIGIMDPNATEL